MPQKLVFILIVPRKYPPGSILYRWQFREDDGLVRLIGTDPGSADPTQFFRWPDLPGGWEKREPWVNDLSTAEVVDNAVGFASGWPGAILLRGRGRPPKDLSAEPIGKPVSVQTGVRRSELFEIQRLASYARQSVSEWAASALRAALAQPASASAPPRATDATANESATGVEKSVMLKTFLRREELFEIQNRASDGSMSVSEWFAAIIRGALASAKKP